MNKKTLTAVSTGESKMFFFIYSIFYMITSRRSLDNASIELSMSVWLGNLCNILQNIQLIPLSQYDEERTPTTWATAS